MRDFENRRAKEPDNDKAHGLSYYTSLLDSALPDTPGHSAAMWDERADEWEKDYNPNGMRASAIRKSDDRIQDTVDYLYGRGLLGPDCDIVDIGCGPGRFAVAFARSARHVTGIDFSERMIHYGVAYARREGMDNTSFLLRDFHTLDIKREGLANRFDLVFSSITPAIHGMDGLIKSMGMSRKYCCNITHIHSDNVLESQMMQDVFGRERPDPWAGHWRWFYATFNTLFLLGYYPEASYYKRTQENVVDAGVARAKLMVRQLLPPEDQTEENLSKIMDWLRSQSDVQDRLMEISEVTYGRLLWDVRGKTERSPLITK